MSGHETNPFADPNSDPFADQVVRDARGGGAQSDNLFDFNPFSSEQTQTKIQQPAVLPDSSAQRTPYSAPSQSAAYDAGTEDIRRRQEELERKAAELERRERAMQQTVQGQYAINNFPPLPSFCPVKPCFYQDFALDIPAEFQRIVKAGYYTWIAYSVVLILNVVGAVAYFVACIDSGESTSKSGVTLGLSLVYLIFIPISFLCWYRPLYKAFRSDSSFNFFFFFFVFFFQACICIWHSFGFPGAGTVGWISAAAMIGSNKAAGGIMFVVGVLFIAMAVICFILLFRVHHYYRATGASFTKAQQEFAEGVVTNRTVQQTATGVATSAARSAVDQYGSSGSSRY